MKWFLNMKIGTKLILSFIIVAFIAGAIGAVGFISTYTLRDHLDEVADVRLPGVNSLLMISEAQTAVRAGLRNLANPEMTLEQKKQDYAYIETSLARSEEYWEIYEALPKSLEETRVWEQFTPLWNNWRLTVDNAVEAAQDYDESLEANASNQTQLLNELLIANSISAEAFHPTGQALLEVVDINRKHVHEANQSGDSAVSIAITLISGITVFGVIISIVLGIVVANIIKKPINKMLVAAERIADRDLNIDVRVESKDEIGILTKAFLRMTDNINDVMMTINSASEQVAAGSNQVSSSSMSLSQGATEQASSIEELTASIEEIASQTTQNASNADRAEEMATSAQKYAEQGNSQMIDMLKAMEEINDSSNSISKIIKVIDDIAFQTNILALNAAVEAARAGQHGKGFAVVAEEVRNLAARSASAAKETTAMIEGSIQKVEGGTKIANETAEALNKIVAGISQATMLVTDIASASQEQALSVEQINQGIMQISDVVQTTSATAEETAAASEELSSQADMLKAQVATFKLKNSKKVQTKDTVDPEILKMLNNMKSTNANEKNKKNNKRIALSDTEFEKY